MNMETHHTAGNPATSGLTSGIQMRQLSGDVAMETLGTNELVCEIFPHGHHWFVILLPFKTVLHVHLDEFRDVDVAACVFFVFPQFFHDHLESERDLWLTLGIARIVVNDQLLLDSFIL